MRKSHQQIGREQEVKTANPPKKTRFPRFVGKDYLNILISTFALLVSIVGVYYSNIKEENRLSGKIIDFKLVGHFDDYKLDSVSVQIAFINSGNREALVQRPLLELEDSINSKHPYKNYFEAISSPTFPFVIEPKQIKIVQLKIPLENIFELYLRKQRSLANALKPHLKTKCESYCKFWFFGLDSNGLDHNNWSDYQIKFSITNYKLTEVARVFSPLDSTSFKSTKIF